MRPDPDPAPLLVPDRPAARQPREAVAVTFEVPDGLAGHAQLVAEFTAWTPMAMDRMPDGSHRLRVLLPTGHTWGYQFVLDDRRIVNDPNAREFASGSNGGYVSVIRT